MSGKRPDVTGIDLDRVFRLYSVKGTLVRDVAFSMGITVPQVKEALRARESLRRLATVPPPKPKPVPEPKLPKKVDGVSLLNFEQHCRKCPMGFSLEKDKDGRYLAERTRGAFDFWVSYRAIRG